MLQKIIEDLYEEYQEKGFVSENHVLIALTEANIQLADIDHVCDQLLSMGVIIQGEPSAYINDENDRGYDRSQTDYESLFDEVLSIDQSLVPFIGEARQIQPPQHREWQRLLPQAKNGNQFAYRRIVLMYLRSVIKIALAYHKKQGTHLAETIQEGCIGLILAIKKYEIGRQDVFPQYYPWWVVRNIQRRLPFIANPIVYFPMHVREKLNSIYEIIMKHQWYVCEENDLCPSLVIEVADCLKCSESDAESYIHYYRGNENIEDIISNNPTAFSDHGSFYDNVLESYYREELRIIIKILLDSLSDREEKVLRLRFGFNNGRAYTLEQIGQYFGVTRERIRQIEAKALRKLQRPSIVSRLRTFWDEI